MALDFYLHPIIHKFAAVRNHIADSTHDEVPVDEIRDLGWCPISFLESVFSDPSWKHSSKQNNKP